MKRGQKHSEEAKAKMRGRVPSADTRRRWSEIRRGKRHAPETLAKMSASRTGMTYRTFCPPELRGEYRRLCRKMARDLAKAIIAEQARAIGLEVRP